MKQDDGITFIRWKNTVTSVFLIITQHLQKISEHFNVFNLFSFITIVSFLSKHTGLM